MGKRRYVPEGAEVASSLRRLYDVTKEVSEAADGTQLDQAVAKLRVLRQQVEDRLNEIPQEVQDALALIGVYTKAETDAKVASPGNISPGNVTVGGALRAMSVYSTIGTSDYRAVWVTGVDGQLLYVPSSARFKQDISAAVLDPAVVLALRLVTFRYMQAVAEKGAEAAVEIGLIAEEVDALGLTWLVDYDDDGLPFGVKFEKLALALLAVVQDHEQRLVALESAHFGDA